MSWRRKISRLIDVDALIDYLGFDNTEEEREKNIGEIVTLDVFDKQPTAFDVDKVAESLMNRFRVVYNDEDLEWNRAIDYAIKIVKGGGDYPANTSDSRSHRIASNSNTGTFEW